ncbi:MAG: hypothetical protein HQK83_16765, partial [Fibrobacteria bacterium]|nr:hypothetical protein [Fibrobacteria bacterium]
MSAKVSITEHKITVSSDTGLQTLSLRELTTELVDWMNSGRKDVYKRLLNNTPVRFFEAHLPVLVTQQPGSFGFNCANKGVGFLPKHEYLDEYINLFQETIDNTRNKPIQESLKERIKAVSDFYFKPEKMDTRLLTSLEIFEKRTYNNIVNNPLVSLHYTGALPDYTSFQLNCAVEIVGPEDPRYTFIKLARVMFEFDDFHITQRQFPHAYLFWISEVLNKTPFPVAAREDVAEETKSGAEYSWS